MLNPQFILPLARELVIDLFAGGGGASTGIEAAIGRHVDIAINHDPEAVSLHEANHPQTRHFCSDVFEVHPLEVTGGQPVGLLWASPDCKHFSKAKGGKPVSKKIRGLAWVVVKWANLVRPRIICLENVEEFQTWGPLAADGRPCPQKKGQTFAIWKRQLENMGYVVEHRELRACDYNTPTIRKRFFLIARCDGMPIVWPEQTHAKADSLLVKQKKLKPWRAAAECMDWNIPVPSIFERKRPLADATCRRIAKGIMRYVVEASEPFIVCATHGEPDIGKSATPSGPAREPGSAGCGSTGRQIDVSGAPFVPTLIQTGYGERPSRWRCGGCGCTYDRSDLPVCGCTKCGSEQDPVEMPGQAPRALDIGKPLGTLVGSQKHAIVSAFLAKHYTGVVGSDMRDPMATVTSVDHHSLVTAHLTKFRSGSVGSAMDEPVHTVTAGGTPARASTGNVMGLITANLVHLGHGEGRDGGKRFSHGIRDVTDPLNTVTASGAAGGLVTAHLVTIDNQSSGGGHTAATDPLKTTVTENRHALVTSHLCKLRGDNVGSAMDEPLHTVSAQGLHHAEVRAFLVKYCGAVKDPAQVGALQSEADHLGLVTVQGTQYAIVDIGLRMLTPRELYRAQGFPETYIIDHGADGQPFTKTSQVRMCGNSVPPPMSEALARANYVEPFELKEAA